MFTFPCDEYNIIEIKHIYSSYRENKGDPTSFTVNCLTLVTVSIEYMNGFQKKEALP